MKVIAVVLAMLMLVTMAAACKKQDDAALIGGGSSTVGNVGGNQGNNGDGTATDPSNPGSTTDPSNPGSTTTNPGAVPDTGNKEAIENFTPNEKYNFAKNPLMVDGKKANTGTAPSFDIDTTGFVKNNIKLADLKGKSLTMILALEQANFIYHGPNGEKLNEWTWFDSLKKTYGLTIKTIESKFDKAPQLIITYMNSGKALDIIPTHRSAFPQYLMISGGLNNYINEKYIDNSPGIDKRTMDQTKWDGQYRCIAPIGAVDVIWYNETMTKQLGLDDPHTLYTQGKWTWDAWKTFQTKVPKQSPNGTTQLAPFSMSEGDAWTFWARANGVSVFEIKTEGNKSKIVSNFADPRCAEAWVFYAGVVKGVDYVARRNSAKPQTDMYKDGSCIMSGTQYLMNDYSGSDMKYAKTNKYNWVPYPTKDGKGICTNYGNTMILPKKTKNQANIPYAVKFAELWASRFTEAINDYLMEPYYDFSSAERVEYFNYAAKTNYFNVGARIFDMLTGNDKEYYNKLIWSFYNPNYNTATQAEQLKPLVDKAVKALETYGN
jgi:hypothetical protein